VHPNVFISKYENDIILLTMNKQRIASIKALSAAAAIIFAVGLHPARANAQAGGCSERSTDRGGRVLREKNGNINIRAKRIIRRALTGRVCGP